MAGLGARIALDFVDPGGAGTGRLLPTGHARDVVGGVEASCVDATNPVVFVRARDLGLTGAETPQAVDADHELGARLEKLRVEAAARMGMAESAAVPKIAFVAPAADYTGLDGARHGLIDYWLQPLRELAERHEAELSRLGDTTARQNRLCELSVALQVRRLAETPIVQDAWARGQRLRIHGLVYGLQDGRLRDLGCTREG